MNDNAHRIWLWLRWSWRDLRAHWLQVMVISLVIALGTGVYAGMGSTTPWRSESYDNSYARLNMYDLRLSLTEGSFIARDAMLSAVQGIDHADAIASVEARLLVPTFVSVAGDDGEILVRGQLVGVDVSTDGPHVNRLFASKGRLLRASDSGQPVAMLEHHFADYYGLPANGQIHISGSVPLEYVGWVMTPEYFMVITPDGGYMAQASYAAVFTSLSTAQQLTDRPGLVNDLILTVPQQAQLDIVQAELEAVMLREFPDTGVTITGRADDPVYDMMYRSNTMNQEIYDVITYLFLAGAMFGAFNLASRIVEAQRRQIGIGMALGMPPRLLAVRPLLVGIQIAVMGMVFGLVLGLVLAEMTGSWVGSVLPMPYSGRLFHPDVFLEAAGLGVVLPIVATLYPVWRAVRVLPVEAIRTGHLVAQGGGWVGLVKHRSMPGKSFTHMPLSNLLRAPRRTMLTVLGIGAAITTLIGLTGVQDSTFHTMDAMRDEALQTHPERMLVFLNAPLPVRSSEITSLAASEAVESVVPSLRVPGQISRGEASFEILIDALDYQNNLWVPTLASGSYAVTGSQPGVLLSRKAAADLDVGVGDTITLQHPRRAGLLSFTNVETEVEITGLHADPWRMFVFMDIEQADLFGLAGFSNLVHIDPAAGWDAQSVRRELFQRSSVASVIPAQAAVDSAQTVMKEVITFMSGVSLGVLVLAFLIAFNSTAIAINERAREIATMFAFGLPIRTVTRMAILENLVTGLLGTLLGIGLGLIFTTWFIVDRMGKIMPDIRFDIALSPVTIFLAFAIGVGVVALTPLLAMRRLARMDIPATLRVME